MEQLEALLAWLGVAAASVSIDDFYLTNAQQTALAAAHPDNRLLALRGNAGTHDLDLGQQTLTRLKGLTQAGATAAVPRYDKSAFSGRGDRADPATWPVVAGPLELVFFEGWMSGFRPVGEAAAAAVEPALAEVDARLAAYEAAWDSLVDAWLVIRIADPQVCLLLLCVCCCVLLCVCAAVRCCVCAAVCRRKEQALYFQFVTDTSCYCCCCCPFFLPPPSSEAVGVWLAAAGGAAHAGRRQAGHDR